MKKMPVILSAAMILSLVGCATTSHVNSTSPPAQTKMNLADNSENDMVGPPTINEENTTLPSTSESDIGGTAIGGVVEQRMDETDKTKMLRAMDKAPGKATHWVNAHTNVQYTVTPTKKVRIQDKNYCRQYQITAVDANNKEESIQGVACVASDGNWHILEV
jgi:surface antigen